jgi:hypothetical protein
VRYDHVDDEHPDFDIVCEAVERMVTLYGADFDDPDPVHEVELHLHVEDIRKRGTPMTREPHGGGTVLTDEWRGALALRIRKQAEAICGREPPPPPPPSVAEAHPRGLTVKGAEWRNGDWHALQESPAVEWCKLGRKPVEVEGRRRYASHDWEPWITRKPKRRHDPANVKRWGDILDAVTEHEMRLGATFPEPLFHYYLAMRDWVWWEAYRECRRRSQPSAKRLAKMRRDRAEFYLAYRGRRKLGSGATMRQIIDAFAVYRVAHHAYDSARYRFHDQTCVFRKRKSRK